jgi:potassium-transporting ATPase KdpC subunit
MRRQLLTGLLMTLVLVVLLGVVYPVAVWGVGQVAFKDRADGSFVKDASRKVVGSSLLGQRFVDRRGRPEYRYFQPRPSAAGYDALSSGGSQLGPSNQTLLDEVKQRADRYRRAYGLGMRADVPVDAVTASGSGLDPHISVANARLQAARVSKERGLPVSQVDRLIEQHTQDQQWGFLGEKAVNVLELNLALDAMSR